MTRSEGERERLAREVAVERLAESRGISLSRSGRALVGACPWCGTVDGLSVDREANTYTCSCGQSGGPVEWCQPSRISLFEARFRHVIP